MKVETTLFFVIAWSVWNFAMGYWVSTLVSKSKANWNKARSLKIKKLVREQAKDWIEPK